MKPYIKIAGFFLALAAIFGYEMLIVGLGSIIIVYVARALLKDDPQMHINYTWNLYAIGMMLIMIGLNLMFSIPPELIILALVPLFLFAKNVVSYIRNFDKSILGSNYEAQ